jgi:flagellar motor switch protein FliM
VMAMEPGTRIVLNTAVGAPVLVRCGAVPLFEGRVGRRKNCMAVRIERPLPRAQLTDH